MKKNLPDIFVLIVFLVFFVLTNMIVIFQIITRNDHGMTYFAEIGQMDSQVDKANSHVVFLHNVFTRSYFPIGLEDLPVFALLGIQDFPVSALRNTENDEWKEFNFDLSSEMLIVVKNYIDSQLHSK